MYIWISYWLPALYQCPLICLSLCSTPEGFPVGSVVESNGRNPGSVPGLLRFPWKRAWQPIPVFLPGDFHGQRSLTGYSPWGCKESNTTEVSEHGTASPQALKVAISLSRFLLQLHQKQNKKTLNTWFLFKVVKVDSHNEIVAITSPA